MKKTLLHILMHNGRLLERAIEEELSSEGLHHGQGRILKQIQRHGQLTQAELARRMDLKPATITNMLKPLEQQKLILRQTDPQTNRARLVSLTPAGEKACLRIEAVWDRIENRLRQDLPANGMNDLLTSLETIRHNLGGIDPATIESKIERNTP